MKSSWHVIGVQQGAATIINPSSLILSGNTPSFMTKKLVFISHSPVVISTPFECQTWSLRENLMLCLCLLTSIFICLVIAPYSSALTFPIIIIARLSALGGKNRLIHISIYNSGGPNKISLDCINE